MKAMINDNNVLYRENNIHLTNHSLSLSLSARTHLDCKLDTSPSCKELGLFNKYICFTFDLHVSRLILN